MIDESVEDGSWLIISHVEEDLFNAISFKLYQLRLETDLNKDFRYMVLLDLVNHNVYIDISYKCLFVCLMLASSGKLSFLDAKQLYK